MIQHEEEEELLNFEKELRDIIMNKVQFNEVPFTPNIFQTDLVLKMSVPEKQYIDRNKKILLGQYINNPPQYLVNAYNSAYNLLYKDMEQKEDHINRQSKTLLLRNSKSFEKHPQGQTGYRKLKYPDDEEVHDLKFHNEEQFTGELDAFTINFNTLIYVLQKLCGFEVKSFMEAKNTESQADEQASSLSQSVLSLFSREKSKRQVYILLTINDDNLFHAAARYQIKKEIDYSQLDLFINQPTDSKERPMKLNSTFSDLFPQNINLKKKKSQDSFIFPNKYIDRKLNATSIMSKNNNIIDQADINQLSQQKFRAYTKQLHKFFLQLMNFNTNGDKKGNSLGCIFDNPEDPDQLSPQEIRFIKSINRGKNNPGCEKRFVRLKKKRKFFEKQTQLCKNYGFSTYEQPTMFVDFKIANSNKKFFYRFDSTLFYKYQVVSPYGDLSLFNKMERIKVSFLVLRQFLRTQNLHNLNVKIFALNNKFENEGKILETIDKRERKKQILGGIDGQNLVSNWNKYFLWSTNFKVLRNYLGEAVTFSIFLKTYLILFFIFLCPFSIGAELILILIIEPNNNGFLQNILFNLIYLLILVVFFNAFIEIYNSKQTQFLNNWKQSITLTTFRFQFKGPYIRNPITDSVNQYNTQKTFTIQVLQTIFYLVFAAILCIQIAFYYGCKMLIIALYPYVDYSVAFQTYLFYPIHLIGYGIFFIVNTVLYRFAIVPLANFLTKFQNTPTQEEFNSSKMNKLLLFSIGLEIIIPLDLILIQNLTKTYCYHPQKCWPQVNIYAQTRFVILLLYVIIKILITIVSSCSRIVSTIIEDQDKIVTFSQKLALFRSEIIAQSKKKPHQLSFVDETVSLFHFSTFCIIFPLGSTISLIILILDYSYERQIILFDSQRPISKSQNLKPYGQVLSAIGHWMLFINLCYFWICLLWFQYYFIDIIYALEPIPSIVQIFTIKVFTILIFFIFYEAIAYIIRTIFGERQSITEIRKHNKYRKLVQTGGKSNSKNTNAIHKTYPLMTVARTYNSISVQKQQKDENNKNNEKGKSSKSKSHRSLNLSKVESKMSKVDSKFSRSKKLD